MFAKTIIDSDAFIDMPLSAQALYFHLSMRGDDDGFINNPKKIQRMVGASDDDLKLLIAKRFIIPFDSGIVVIKHWKIHNYIRGDRKVDTVYQEEMSLLTEKDNGAYTLLNEDALPIEEPKIETARQRAYRESSLPYSFEYKIRQAFYGRVCPICGFKMQGCVEDGIESDMRRPTIQHNKPISQGGKHELGNISVICHHCNVTIQDTETGKLNADEVSAVWDEICMTGRCQTNVRQVTGRCQHRLVEDSTVQDNSVEDNVVDSSPARVSNKRTMPPTLEEVQAYCDERGNNVDAVRFVDYYTANGWKAGKNKMKDWKAAVRTWERSGTQKKSGGNPFLEMLEE